MATIFYKHFPRLTPAARRFHELVGRNVILWGRMEANIDDVLWRLTYHPNATVPLPKKLPQPFGEKIKYWRRLFEAEPLTAPLREIGLQIADDAPLLHERRTMIIHASIGAQENRQEGAVALQYKHEIGQTKLRQYKVAISSLKTLESDTLKLADSVSLVATHALFMTLGKTMRAAP